MMNWRSGGRVFALGMVALSPSIALSGAKALAQMPVLAENSEKPTIGDAKVPVFDVASVKENKGERDMMRIGIKPDGFESENIDLKTLIGNAYGIKQDLIFGGPAWVESKGFDVQAKVAGPDIEALRKLTPRQRASMLQPLLAERFKLKLHSETKVLPTYDLVVSKGGPKMKAAAPDPPPVEGAEEGDAHKHGGMMTMGPGMFRGEDLPIASIAQQLSYVVHRTVVDKTGLAGKYDVDLKYASEDAPKQEDGTADATSPSIFTAVEEQLGLKLVPTKGPVETLVIDNVELPSEN